MNTGQNGWVFNCELSGCGFESRCSHLKMNTIIRKLIGHIFKYIVVQQLDGRGVQGKTYVCKTSSGRYKKVTTSHGQARRRHCISKKMSDLRCLEVIRLTSVLKTSNLWHVKNVWFTTSWGHLIHDILKTSDLCCPEVVQLRTSWRCLIYDVLRTFDLGRLENVRLKSSWRCPI